MPKPAGGPAVIEAPPPREPTTAAVPVPAPGSAAAIPSPAATAPPTLPPVTAAPATAQGTGGAAKQPEPPAGLRGIGTALAITGAVGMAIAIAWPLVSRYPETGRSA